MLTDVRGWVGKCSPEHPCHDPDAPIPGPPAPRTISLLRGLVRSPWLRPLNDLAAIDDLLALVRPHWSLSTIRARVVEAVRETADVRTLVLSLNRLWPGHRAGQHVTVEVEIAGRRLRRTFSLSSAPRRDGLVCITVKRREGGKVSGWWNDEARVGNVITLSPPAGQFVLPAVVPRRFVMVSAGSGIARNGGSAAQAGGGIVQTVEASRSARTFAAAASQSLLEAAEQAGLRPVYGCRAGICHTCKCRKLSGVVEDLRDGRVSSEPGEMIQLCVTSARSAVTLEL